MSQLLLSIGQQLLVAALVLLAAAPAQGATLSFSSTYWTDNEADFTGTKTTPLISCGTGTTIKLVSPAFAAAVVADYSGQLTDGRIVTYDSTCYTVLASTFKYGVGASGKPLLPFSSIATSAFALGTTLLVPSFVGKPLPTGRTHNGCVRVDDSQDTVSFSLFVWRLGYTSAIPLANGLTVTPATCTVSDYITAPPPKSPPPKSPPPKSPPPKSPPPRSPPPPPKSPVTPPAPTSYPITGYWIDFEADYTGAATVPLYDSCTAPRGVIKYVSASFAADAGLDGTGLLTDGRLVNILNYDPNPLNECWEVVDRTVAPWGLGAWDNPLVPFVSVASNTLPRNTILYIGTFNGVVVPGTGGKVHNGCWRVDDLCGSCGSAGVPNNDLDLFVLRASYFGTFVGTRESALVSVKAKCTVLKYF